MCQAQALEANTWSDKSRGMHQFPSSFSAVNLILHSCYFCAAIRCWMMLHGLFDCTQVTSESGMFCWLEFLLHLQSKHPSKDEFLVAKRFKTRLPYLQVHFNSSVNLLFSILCLQQCSNIILTESHNRNGEWYFLPRRQQLCGKEALRGQCWPWDSTMMETTVWAVARSALFVSGQSRY